MILLRKATEQDIPVIRHIAETTWEPTYGPIIGREQVEYMLEMFYSKVALLQQFQAGHEFLIAEMGSKDIAFVSYSIIPEHSDAFKLHKIYVLPTVHGKGVGKFLINEVVNKVRHAGGKTLALNVNRANKAKDFYERAGFKIKETVDLEIGNGYFMNDYVMEITI